MKKTPDKFGRYTIYVHTPASYYILIPSYVQQLSDIFKKIS